jgi:hypothetical protein
MKKFIISSVKLNEADTFHDTIPLSVDVVSEEDLHTFLSFKAMTLGYTSVDKYLSSEGVWVYSLTDGAKLRRFKHV